MSILERLAAVSPFFNCIEPSTIKEELFKLESFKPGELIVRKGDKGSKAYVIVHGVIGLYDDVEPSGKTPFLKVSRGKLLGTYAMLCDEARSATAMAMTETILASIERAEFNQLMDASPELCKRVLTSLAREASRGREPNQNSRVRCVLIREHLQTKDNTEPNPICTALSQLDNLEIIDRRSGPWDPDLQLPEITSHLALERSVAFLINEQTSISRSTQQLIDANILIVHGNEINPPPSIGVDEIIDLIRIWPAQQERPSPFPLDANQQRIRHVYNVREGREADAYRVARCLLGIGNTLVLGGGGAKGFAHVGAIKAIEEMGITDIDWICGVSIGSFVGMLYAFEMPWEAICAYTKRIFVTGQPYAFSPSAHSLLRYSESLLQLEIDFGSYSIHDTWIPFRPATADITNNRLRFWAQGGLLKSVIASMSIPGILPPVRMEDGSIHVDGSVMDNLPIDEARRCTSGCVIAISLDHGEGQRMIPTLARTENKLMRWLASLGWANRALPLITDTIMYSILGASRQKSDDAEHLADLLLKPDVMSIGLLEWSRFAVALEAGYQAAKQSQGTFEALRQCQPPIADN